MPKPMAEAAIANREIVEIALEEEIPQRNICMVYDIHHPISAAARELKKVISDSYVTYISFNTLLKYSQADKL